MTRENQNRENGNDRRPNFILELPHRVVDGLRMMRNRFLTFGRRPPTFGELRRMQERGSDYNLAETYTHVYMPRSLKTLWMLTVLQAGYNDEIVWAPMFYINDDGTLTFAQLLPLDPQFYQGMGYRASTRPNPYLAALNTWYFTTWNYWKATGQINTTQQFGFLGYAHSHPPDAIEILSSEDVSCILENITDPERPAAIVVAGLGQIRDVEDLGDFNDDDGTAIMSARLNISAKVFVARPEMVGNGRFYPQEIPVVFVDDDEIEMPELPPLSWHLENWATFTADLNRLRNAGYQVSYRIVDFMAGDLPYLRIQIENHSVNKYLIISTDYDFPNSRPKVEWMLFDDTTSEEIPLSMVWDGGILLSDIVARAYDSLEEPTHASQS